MQNKALILHYWRFFLVSCFILFATSTSAQGTLSLDYQIAGVPEPALSNALQRLKDIQARYNQVFTPETIDKLYQEGPKEIKAALKPFGYFKAKIQARLIQQNNRWIARYQIKAGPQVTIGQVNLTLAGEGATNPELLKFINHFLIKKEQPLNIRQYEAAKQRFFEIAQNQGYLKAEIATSEVKIDLKQNKAYITVTFATGPCFYFGPVTFQNHALSPQFLQRYVTFKQGEPYSSDALLSLQDDLSNSPYFNQVLINPQSEQAEANKIPIIVKLKPRPAQQYDIGLGYGTDTGPRGSLGVQLRRLTKTGQRFNSDLKVSQVSTSLLVNYIFPGTHPNTDEYRLFAGLGNDERGQGNSNTRQIGTSYISKIADWQQTLKLAYQIENFRLTREQDYQRSHLLIPSIAWSKVKTDNILFPENGFNAQFTVRSAVDHYISDDRFVQALLEYKWIHSYGRSNRILLHTNLGYTVADDADRLPLSIRFYSGGSKSVRGYGYQELGPGRYLAEASAEFQHRVKGNWYGAVFYDIGNAFNNFDTALKRSVGIGVVWASPIGPINLSLARALDSEGQPLMVQFSMGPDL